MATVIKQRATIIPRAISGGEELVVIPRKEYEKLRLRKFAHRKDIVILEEVPLFSLTPEQRAAYRKAKRTPLSKMLNI